MTHTYRVHMGEGTTPREVIAPSPEAAIIYYANLTPLGKGVHPFTGIADVCDGQPRNEAAHRPLLKYAPTELGGNAVPLTDAFTDLINGQMDACRFTDENEIPAQELTPLSDAELDAARAAEAANNAPPNLPLKSMPHAHDLEGSDGGPVPTVDQQSPAVDGVATTRTEADALDAVDLGVTGDLVAPTDDALAVAENEGMTAEKMAQIENGE